MTTQGIEVITKQDGTMDVEKMHDVLWQNTKKALMEGLDASTNFDGSPNPEKVELLGQMLDKIKADLVQKMLFSNTDSDATSLMKVVLPVARRIFPSLLAHELIDVMIAPDVEFRSLCARWTFEAAGDAYVSQGIDIEAEIMAALAQEIIYEIDLVDCIDNLMNYAPAATHVYKLLPLDASLSAKIFEAAKEIKGNRVVVSPTAITMLLAENALVRTSTTLAGYVGTIGDLKVYCNQYAADNSPVLICRQEKGNSAATLKITTPISSAGVHIDPQTFEPVVSFNKRIRFESATDIQDKLRLVTIDVF